MDNNKAIRIGVFGCWRGSAIAQSASIAGAQIVAACDRDETKFDRLRKLMTPDGRFYTDFEEFINHDMDACILTNYYTEHTPYAIRLLERGISVLSEVACSVTMAQSVALVRAVEKSKALYMLAENYPYSAPCQELRRIVSGGTLGRVVYAEGEYVHPMSVSERLMYAPTDLHWRNFIPSTYYNTHALGPLMYATDAIPVSINAQSVCRPEVNDGTVAKNDPYSLMLCRMSDGSVFTFSAWAAIAGHGNWYRVSGTKGVAETVRGDSNRVRLVYNSYNLPTPQTPREASYYPQFPCDGDKAAKTGHAGGDYFVARQFIDCLQNGTQPYFDVYRATAMASVGILGWRSALEDGKSYRIPDFRSEDDRRLWESDTLSPFPMTGGDATLPCSVGER